jgi:hypothetical protein
VKSSKLKVQSSKREERQSVERESVERLRTLHAPTLHAPPPCPNRSTRKGKGRRGGRPGREAITRSRLAHVPSRSAYRGFGQSQGIAANFDGHAGKLLTLCLRPELAWFRLQRGSSPSLAASSVHNVAPDGVVSITSVLSFDAATLGLDSLHTKIRFTR